MCVSIQGLFFSRIQVPSRLGRIDFPVHPAPFQQLGVGAAVHQRAAVHDENHIAVHGGGHPLGDIQLGLPWKILVLGGAELRFRQEVQRGKAVVKNVDGRILQQRTGNAQPLFLSAGQVLARLADHVVDTIREAVHEFSGLRDLQRFPDLHVPRLQPAHAHIVPDGAGIDGRVLQHQLILSRMVRRLRV